MNQNLPPTLQRSIGRKTRVLFVHQNFPGQFRRIALHLAGDPDYEVLAIGKQGCPQLAGVRTLTYTLHRRPTAAAHAYAKPYEAGILHGQAVLRLLQKLKVRGFVPDVIVAHAGWGETLFVKDIFPATRLIHFSEYYYHAKGADVGFDKEFPVGLNDVARVRAKNALQLLNLENCDIAVAPTQWQKSLHPQAYQHKIELIHEGIDTDLMRPDPQASFTLPSGKVLRPGDPVVTYVARNLEPYRGFHVFMRALPEILARNPECDIVIVGGDGASYGSLPKDAPDWRTKMLREVAIDPARVYFLGQIPYASYRKLLQVSAAHVYLTYPFVLSWSMLEAMACSCLVIGSNTAPVREVIRDRENGVLVDFFDGEALARSVTKALAAPQRFAPVRARAAHAIRAAYSSEYGISKYKQLIDQAVAAAKSANLAGARPLQNSANPGGTVLSSSRSPR
jgi:glycosyltransferase involved in cell wall biosynthesis